MEWLLTDLPNLVGQYGPWLLMLCVALLLAGGFGLPLPEDIPLFIMGYLAYSQVLSLWVMIPVAFTAVMIGDLTMYLLGRKYGYHITQLWPFKRYLSPPRLAKAGEAFHAHGGKTLFLARFLPGLRSPVFFSAGLFKIPAWKMLVFDGSAALISVPTLVLIAYFAGVHLEKVRHWTAKTQMVLFAVIFGIIACVIAIKLYRRSQRKNRA